MIAPVRVPSTTPVCLQTFQQLQAEATTTVASSTPSKPAVEEEVYESDPVPNEDEAAWREVADRIDPQSALRG